MKNLLMSVLFVVFIFSSCNKEEITLERLENQTLTFDAFFEKVSGMDIQTSKENVILINYMWNKKNNSITIINSEEKEPSWGAAIKVASLKKISGFQQRSSGKKEYTVSCSNGDESWEKGCSGKFSCGKLIANCLDEGGCAEICKASLEYYPPEKIFLMDSDVSDSAEFEPKK